MQKTAESYVKMKKKAAGKEEEEDEPSFFPPLSLSITPKQYLKYQSSKNNPLAEREEEEREKRSISKTFFPPTPLRIKNLSRG